MTQIKNGINENRHVGIRRMVKNSLKIDMTPMVDLGFLLISFFVITAQLSQSKAMNLYMPKDGPPTPLGESNALTILLGDNNRIFYYNGDWKDAAAAGNIYATNFSGSNGLRDVILEKQIRLETNEKNKEGRNRLMLMIKPGNEASYINVEDALDEATICMVKKYAVIKLFPNEASWLKEKYR